MKKLEEIFCNLGDAKVAQSLLSVLFNSAEPVRLFDVMRNAHMPEATSFLANHPDRTASHDTIFQSLIIYGYIASDKKELTVSSKLSMPQQARNFFAENYVAGEA